jgi:adenylate cyclase
MPGVEVHAQLLETILSDSHLTRPFEVIMIEWGLILIGGIMMIILVPRLNSIWTFLLAIALIGSLLGIAWHYYTSARELVDASYPSLCIFSMFVVLSYLNYMREERERAQVKDAFSHYVSPALLEQLAENPEKLSLGGETREISVLFSDIRGFTTISERFNAQELTRFINKFLTPMTNVILERQGTIDKYMGDAIMAFWNAPLEVPNHPHQACHAALEMQVAVKALNELLREESESEGGAQYMPINIGVGINTDECCVGNMGSDQRFDYSALGDGVNLGARLEGQSKTYGVDIVLGPNTYEAVKDDFATIELDLIQVKGKTEPVQIYALLGGENVRDDASFRQLKQYAQQMIASYRRCEWDEAEAAAKSMAAADASLQTLAQLYFGRIAEYRKTPPPDDWAGVFIATSK